MDEDQSIYNEMSKSEKEVADFLQEINIWWRYEHPIFVYDEKGRPRVWTPDFYLPELGIYIEVCGSEDFDYNYRKEVYSNNRIPVIFLHYFKEKSEWQNYLKKKLKDIYEYRSKIKENLKER